MEAKVLKVGTKYPVEGEHPPETGRIIHAKVVKVTKTSVKSTRRFDFHELPQVGVFVQDMLDRYSTRSLRISNTHKTGVIVHSNETYWKVEQEG